MYNTVLVVDDSRVMRKMIEDVLTKAGYTVVASARNSDEALSQFAEKKPDIVTLDIIMPGELGINIIRRFCEMRADTCIVIVSGLHQKSMLQDAFKSGARGYVVKPFGEEDLLNGIKKAIESIENEKSEHTTNNTK